MKSRRTIYGMIIMNLGLTVATSAQVPQGTAFTYQGLLKQTGAPFNGSANMVFELYDDSVVGNPVGTLALNPVTVADGLFTVDLDFGVSPFTANEARWLQITIDGTPLSPRQRISSAPHSLSTRGINVDAEGNVDGQAGVAFGNDGEVGLEPPPAYPYYSVFDFSHTITDFSATDGWTPFQSLITLDPTEDLTGENESYIFGHDLETLIAYGNSHDIFYAQGPYLGIYKDDGPGTIDYMLGTFVLAESDSGTVIDQTALAAISVGDHDTVIEGNYGVYVVSGHYGDTGSVAHDYSVYIETPDHTAPIENHVGLYLADQVVATDSNYAIYSAGGDVYLNGNVEVTGSFSSGGGGSLIDHPLDPENKYLRQPFVESPDMMSIHNGNVTTDETGFAAVSMPGWFEALNRDFRYQLTVIGQFAQAIVAEELTNNRFVIRTDRPRVKVSWQVTGIRHDPFANQNRVSVERDKPDEERGKYLHPEAHGQPSERKILKNSNGQRETLTKPHRMRHSDRRDSK